MCKTRTGHSITRDSVDGPPRLATVSALKPPGLHTTIREIQTCGLRRFKHQNSSLFLQMDESARAQSNNLTPSTTNLASPTTSWTDGHTPSRANLRSRRDPVNARAAAHASMENNRNLHACSALLTNTSGSVLALAFAN